jgi:two-component system sensor histidine kinase VicK
MLQCRSMLALYIYPVNAIDQDSFYTSASFQSFFRLSPQSLVMKADAPRYTILAVSDLYLSLVHKQRHELLGNGLFEVFPGSEGDPTEQYSVAASFQRAMQTGKPDELPVFKYEIFVPESGQLETYYWSNVNEPIAAEQGAIAYLINITTNVTERVKQQQALDNALKREQALNEELAASNEELRLINDELNQMNQELDKSRSELQTAYASLEDSEIALRLAIEAANFGTWHIHSVTRAFQTSARLRELFGYRHDEEITIDDALAQITDEYRGMVAKRLEDAIYNGGDYDVTYPVVGYYDKIVRWLRAIGNLKADASGEFSSFTGVVMDVSELKQDEQRKNDFIGMVSHELKTPLTSMKGYVQLLKSKAIKSEDKHSAAVLDKANNQINKMTTLINGFLNVSRLESGKIHINKQVFDMALLVKEAEEESITTISSHKVVFAPVLETIVSADRDKIGQVINNFISNAVKYSPAGTVINIACVTLNGEAVVSVRDEGMGIAPENIEKLFERYYRVDNDNKTSVAGFGIGLYLCSEIIERHQGKIWVESELKKGSTFFFTLPVSQEEV